LAIQERTIETERGPIAYLESGAGWPLVLLHAFPVHAGMWRPQLEAVSGNWRFIAPDFRGFGRTPRGSHPLTIEGFAADVGALLDALEIQEAAIAGVSMGGYVAFAMFRQEPGRVASLVLADTKAAADSPAARAGRVRLREVAAAQGARGVADQMLPKLLSKDAPPGVVSRVRAMIESADPVSIDAAIMALMTRPDSIPDLPRISRATLIVVGEHDSVTPLADAQVMQQGIARSRLTVVPGAGHLSSVEQPEAFAKALADFLVAGA
jgi:pimeloyl-ACP methyl ester carboxylesterase